MNILGWNKNRGYTFFFTVIKMLIYVALLFVLKSINWCLGWGGGKATEMSVKRRDSTNKLLKVSQGLDGTNGSYADFFFFPEMLWLCNEWLCVHEFTYLYFSF